MCFSATASFTAAAATAFAGVATMSYARFWREVPLASIPFVFAGQQAIEGMTWVQLMHHAHDAPPQWLPNLFAYIALGLWPVLSPLSLLLVETVFWRRVALGLLLALAMPIAEYGVSHIHDHPYTACIVGNCISYVGGVSFSPVTMALYVACAIGPMLLSSHRMLFVLGAILLLGLAISLLLFYEAFVSVWCFFAAVASLVLVIHFISGRRLPFPARQS